MPHQFQIVDCRKCGEAYCPVCKEKCPKCGKVDITDTQTIQICEQMRKHNSK